MPEPGLPLFGVTVLDLSDEATVFGTRLLAELGARVVRVEDAGGDAIRRRGPFLRGEPGLERSLAHLLYNAGKESVALDLGHKAAWAAVERLAIACDVVVGPSGRSPGVDRLFDRLAEAGDSAPGVVEVVFRRDAPTEVATDLVATAAGGLLVLGGHPEDPPNHPKGDLAYKQVSLAAAEAAVALVLEKRRMGRAGRIVVSLQEAVNLTTVQTANANWWHWHERIPTRHTPLTAFSIYRSRDERWLSFTVHPPNWPHYVEWVERELGATGLTGPEWADGIFRAMHAAELAEHTGALCALFTRDELVAEGQRRGLLVLPVNSLEDLATDPHLVARGFFQEVDHPQHGEPLRTMRSAFLASGWPAGAHRAPSLGEHTGDALHSIAGLSGSEIAGLFGAGVASGNRPSKPAPQPAHTAQHAPRSATRATVPGRHQPLRGVRILDFCWAIAGPLGTRLLADLGADVIKVESAYRLDPIRYIGVQPKDEMSWDTNGQFNDCNTNKRAITLNLNTPEGVDVARRLAETADVVTSNYTPDRLDRWGLGYEALRRARPGIIVANLAVMGIRGPHMAWRSYGNGIVAACGLGALTGFPGRDPIGIGTLHTDFTVPYFAAMQIMAAVLQRDRTGEGQYLELSQYEASVHLLDTELLDYLNGGAVAERNGNRSLRMAPHGVFPSEGLDRWVAIACRDDADWARLRGATGISGPDDLAGRLREVEAVEAAVSAWTSTRGNWEGAAILQAAGVPASPVEDLGELLGRDAAMNRDYRELPLPSGVSALVQEEPITWDGERLPLRRAPLWGEHTAEILAGELGLTSEEIAELAAKNVLF
jgi:crotonobetainyl-CoA:carnitine CoA-transferase CaiB-like acyl-CoA transferase